MNTASQVYCKSAIFTCTCCAYATTIYSDTEWIAVAEELYCETCKGDCKRNCDGGIIFRDDIDPDFPLHMQMTCLPEGLHHCENNLQPGRAHWTIQLVNCPHCVQNTMLFTAYNTGKHILQFDEACVDNAKPSHPNMEWVKDGADKYFILNGPGSDFSAT